MKLFIQTSPRQEKVSKSASKPVTAGSILVFSMLLARLPSAEAKPDWDKLYDKPLDQVSSLAAKGDAAAQASMSYRLLHGVGTKTDIKGGLDWLKKAVAQKFPPAEVALGRLYEEGALMPEDYKMAAKLYQEAVAANYIPAKVPLGYLYLFDTASGGLQNYNKGISLWKEAAAAGSERAAMELGELYRKGSKDVKRDDKEAIHWYTRACELGNNYSGEWLADYYSNGKGTPKDLRAALVFYSRNKNQPQAKYWYKRLSGKQPLPESELRQATNWMNSNYKNRADAEADAWDTLHRK